MLSELMGINKNMEDSLPVNRWNLEVCVLFSRILINNIYSSLPSLLFLFVGRGSRHQGLFMDPSVAEKSLDIYKVVTTHSYIAFLGCYFGQDVAWPDGVTGYGETVYPERETERIVFDSEFDYDVCLFIYALSDRHHHL